MNNKIKFLLLLIFCISLMQISIAAQANSSQNTSRNIVDNESLKTTDEEIKSLEKQLIELKEKKIREYEEEIQKTKAEVEKLKGGSDANLPSVKKTETETQNQVTLQNNENNQQNPQTKPSMTETKDGDSKKNEATNKCALVKLDQKNATALDDNLCKIAENAANDKNQIFLKNSRIQVLTVIALKLATVLNPQNTNRLSDEAVKKSLFFESERKRTDKQVGASSESPGTTSLVIKGGAPAIIGWAVENGSATSSIDGNTVTVRVNPFNLGRAVLSRQSIFTIKDSELSDTPFDGFVKKLSFGFSFDTTRGQQTPTFIVSKQQLSAWSVRYEFINQRNPLSKRYDTERQAFLSNQLPNVKYILAAEGKIAPPFEPDPDKQKPDGETFKSKKLDDWFDETNKQLNAISKELDSNVRTELIRDVIEKRLESLPIAEITSDEGFISAMRGFTDANEKILQDRKDFLDKVNRGAILTLEYTNNREINAPDTSNLRFIWEQGFQKRLDFTLNAETTFFNKKPATTNVKRIKDFNVAFQFDAPMNDILPFGNSVLSGAFRYTRQQSNVVLPNGVVADGTKGDILFGQVKLTIPVFDTGIKLPFSLTFGNRSEFIKERFTRANFGLTFDLDQLFRPTSLFK